MKLDFLFHGFSTLQISILAFSAVLIGINKTGMPGLGLLPVVLLANTFEPGFATGLQLIMLAMADIPAGYYYRKTVNWKTLGRLIPAALGGIAIGSLVLRLLPGSSLNFLIGCIILGLCALTVIKEIFWKDMNKVPTHWSFSAFFGLLAGFATQVANAAGPIMVIYLLSMRFEKKEYMGTAAWYFLLLNWTKIPIFVWEGRITEASVYSAASMIPLSLVGAALGIVVLKKLPQVLFERIVLILSGLAAVKMLF